MVGTRREGEVVERSGQRGAGVSFLLRGGRDVDGMIPHVVSDPGEASSTRVRARGEVRRACCGPGKWPMSWDKPGWPSGCDQAGEVAVAS